MAGLDGRVAIVTGGTGALGRAVCAAFLRAGAKTVVAPYIVEAEVPLLQQAAGEFRNRVETPHVDIGREADVQDLVRRTVERHGPLDVLVNLAGGFAMGSVEQTSESDWDGMIALNLKTAFLCCKAAVPEMRRNKWGRILCIASRPGALGIGGLAAYSVAKGGIITLVRALAEEVRDDDITVNAIAPSVIDTEANRKAMPDADPSRWVTPEDIAHLLTFLAGEEARAISGALIPIYGKA